MDKITEIPKEKLEPSKKSSLVLFAFLGITLILSLVIKDLRLKRIVVVCCACTAIVTAVIDFLWDLVLPTKARKEREAAQLQGIFYWLQDYGYQIDDTVFLKHKLIQLVYANDKLPTLCILWDGKIKRIFMMLWGKLHDEDCRWVDICDIAEEWLGLEDNLDNFLNRSYEEVCEDIFPALGIHKCDEDN